MPCMYALSQTIHDLHPYRHDRIEQSLARACCMQTIKYGTKCVPNLMVSQNIWFF